ncbi:hypothetical protein NP233_g5467 [Leucocoprinus birnbaumii]|uniref:Uncharacterized protein n=1 Tax=Leucocoprinus birnbaumii TaxID=56174 RepID=A0AAD5VT83_9AGAR|nr:hypothetical protein NP233_g5467 [Leucocoprinus birnbaumii]
MGYSILRPPCLSSPPAPLVPHHSKLSAYVHATSTSDADGKTPIKSSIYVVPYSVPARSTIANAMGHANAGARWLAGSSSEKNRAVTPQDASRTKLVVNMRTAVEQNRPQAANTLFTEWEKREQDKSQDGSAAILDYSLVKDILDAIIQPQKPPSPLYSSEVVRHLIEKGVVRSAMLESGLLAALRLRNDWPSIDLALQYIPDLSENELIETLNVVVQYKPSETTMSDPNAMQVDSAQSPLAQTPSLSEFLASMLRHRQFTTPQLVAALRHHLRSAEAITSVAQLLDAWLKRVQSQDVKLVPGRRDVAKNEHGVFVVKQDTAKPKSVADLPNADQLLDFLQSLLDASFLTLIQHPPAHKVLKSLKAHIEPEISALSQTEQLRGVVAGFAKAHANAVREAEIGKVSNVSSKEDSKKDWRQRKREAHEQVAMAIGTYQLEELTL